MPENIENQVLTHWFSFLRPAENPWSVAVSTHCGSSKKNNSFYNLRIYLLYRQKNPSLSFFCRTGDWDTERSENVPKWLRNNDPSIPAVFCKNILLYQGLMLVGSEYSCSITLWLGFEKGALYYRGSEKKKIKCVLFISSSIMSIMKPHLCWNLWDWSSAGLKNRELTKYSISWSLSHSKVLFPFSVRTQKKW